jgi:hypothetical protein
MRQGPWRPDQQTSDLFVNSSTRLNLICISCRPANLKTLAVSVECKRADSGSNDRIAAEFSELPQLPIRVVTIRIG